LNTIGNVSEGEKKKRIGVQVQHVLSVPAGFHPIEDVKPSLETSLLIFAGVSSFVPVPLSK
jgi:hypothetical protein